jgi:hypothetical protein
MTVPEDIRDQSFISHDDVVGLNFIKNPNPCHFRRHYRQGLRSHIMEILKPSDCQMETSGTLIDGVRWYPKARPDKIFRIFRAKLKNLDNALNEIERVKIAEHYLAPCFIAKSYEFVVSYLGPDGYDLMLCGFQEFVAGQILDPWDPLEPNDLLSATYRSLCIFADPRNLKEAQWISHTRGKAAQFVSGIKKMILEKAHIPDLAGVGNLVIVPSGEIKLVDMNNISKVYFDTNIHLDDRGYPVCDKSIEALSILETKLLGRTINATDPVYKDFLDPQRKTAVQHHDKAFSQKIHRFKKACELISSPSGKSENSMTP